MYDLNQVAFQGWFCRGISKNWKFNNRKLSWRKFLYSAIVYFVKINRKGWTKFKSLINHVYRMLIWRLVFCRGISKNGKLNNRNVILKKISLHSSCLLCKNKSHRQTKFQYLINHVYSILIWWHSEAGFCRGTGQNWTCFEIFHVKFINEIFRMNWDLPKPQNKILGDLDHMESNIKTKMFKRNHWKENKTAILQILIEMLNKQNCLFSCNKFHEN